MRKYMGLLVGALLLLALAGCGGKAAGTAEETPGDPTGTVKVVTPQEEQTPEASDGAEQQPAAGGEQTARPPAQQEKPSTQAENTQEPQAPQTPAPDNTGKPEEDIWYEGLEYLPSGSEMVRRASTYKPEKAAQAGNDYLVSKGAALNSAIDPESCGYQEAFIWCSEAFLSGGTAYLTTKMIAATDRALADAYDLDAFEFYCIGEKLEFTGDCNYRLRVYYREKA